MEVQVLSRAPLIAWGTTWFPLRNPFLAVFTRYIFRLASFLTVSVHARLVKNYARLKTLLVHFFIVFIERREHPNGTNTAMKQPYLCAQQSYHPNR